MAEPVELVEKVITSSHTKCPNKETAVSAVKEQLLTHVLPPYVPSDIPEDHLFGCPDCGDRFHLEASLVRHVNRRSVFIAYGCCVCGRSLEFYNRCALLAHLRGHCKNSASISAAEQLNQLYEGKMTLGPPEDNENGDKAATSQPHTVFEPDMLVLSPVPRNKIDVGPLTPMPVDRYGRLLRNTAFNGSEVQKVSLGIQVIDGCDLTDVVHKRLQNILSSTSMDGPVADKNTENLSEMVCSGEDITAKNYASVVCEMDESEVFQPSTDPLAIDLLDTEHEVKDVKKCKECGKEVRSEGHLRIHFLSQDGAALADLTCSTCRFILPSRCSLMAHKRIHMQKRPFICPECTREFKMWSSFYMHMVYTCFHLMKEVRFRCTQCKQLFCSEQSLQNHLVGSHVKHVFKCDMCPVACFSTQTLHEHKLKIHGQTSLTTNSYQQCQLCPDRLILKHRLLFHINEHTACPAARVYVYKCNTCRLYFTRKIDFAAHKSKCRGDLSRAYKEMNTLNVLTNKVLLDKNPSQNNSYKLVYEVPQSTNNMNIAFAPKPLVGKTNINKLVLPNSEMKEMPSKAVIQNVKTVQLTDAAQANILSKISLLKGKALMQTLLPAEDKIKSYQGLALVRKEQLHIPENTKTLKQQHATALSTSRNEEEESGKAAVSGGTSSAAEETITKPENKKNISQKKVEVCAVCHKIIPFFIQTSLQSKLPVICASCSQDHAFVKKGHRLLIVPKKSLGTFVKIPKPALKGKVNAIPEKKSVTKNCDASKGISIKGIVNKLKILPNRNKFKCHICTKLIPVEYDKMKEHYEEKHPHFRLVSPKLKLNSDLMRNPSVSGGSVNLQEEKQLTHKESTNDDDPKKDSQLSKRAVDNDDDGNSKSKRQKIVLQNSTENDNEKDSSFESEQVFESGERKFICFTCKYTDRNQASFREHILKHRNDDNAYQCMECGMCFVVRPSFDKHLFIWHRIKDAEAYIQANDCCNRSVTEDSLDDLDELCPFDEVGEGVQEVLAENQCRVCKETFESLSELKVHFRTHGMAFLRMKKKEIREAESDKSVVKELV